MQVLLRRGVYIKIVHCLRIAAASALLLVTCGLVLAFVGLWFYSFSGESGSSGGEALVALIFACGAFTCFAFGVGILLEVVSQRLTVDDIHLNGPTYRPPN
jgi:cation transporter-like permease